MCQQKLNRETWIDLITRETEWIEIEARIMIEIGRPIDVAAEGGAGHVTVTGDVDQGIVTEKGVVLETREVVPEIEIGEGVKGALIYNDQFLVLSSL